MTLFLGWLLGAITFMLGWMFRGIAAKHDRVENDVLRFRLTKPFVLSGVETVLPILLEPIPELSPSERAWVNHALNLRRVGPSAPPPPPRPPAYLDPAGPVS